VTRQPAGPVLLHDIRVIFAVGLDRIFSADLVAGLIELKERPWCEWNHGKPLTKSTLSRLLRPYGVVSGTVRIGGRTQKGYRRSSFKDAWSRYLPEPEKWPPSREVAPFKTSQPSNGAGCDVSEELPRCHSCYWSDWSPKHGRLMCTEAKPMTEIVPGGCRSFEREPGADG
jgi:putative DNA primase/helicase